MKKKAGLTIRKKMFISYISVTLLLIATGIIGIFYVGRVYNNGRDIYENNIKSVECLKSISENLKELDKCIFHLIVAEKWQYEEECGDKIDALIADNVSLLEAYSKFEITDKEKELYEQGKASVLEYHEQVDRLIKATQLENEADTMKMYQEDLLPIANSTNELIETAVDVAIDQAKQANADNQNIYNEIIWIICFFMLIAVIIAIIISYRMSSYILSKLKSIQMMAKRMSEYNVSDDIETFENDEFGATVEALNESQFMVRELLDKIISESAVISNMGEEVSLAVRKSEQRIEYVNVRILEYEKLANQVEEHVKEVVHGRDMSEEEERTINQIRDMLEEAKEIRESARKELSSIATYLEQIGITSDYQNEIANNHKEQVKKFKVKERED